MNERERERDRNRDQHDARLAPAEGQPDQPGDRQGCDEQVFEKFVGLLSFAVSP